MEKKLLDLDPKKYEFLQKKRNEDFYRVKECPKCKYEVETLGKHIFSKENTKDHK